MPSVPLHLRARRRRMPLTALGLVLGLALTPGCAVLAEEHRHVARTLDRASPATIGAKVALAPVAFPIAALALGADAALINPLVALPKALGDARDVVDVPSTGPLEVFVFPMRCVTFVAVFLGAELVRVWVPL
jgi:hypothetical protein